MGRPDFRFAVNFVIMIIFAARILLFSKANRGGACSDPAKR
jgi:hypothetical protein